MKARVAVIGPLNVDYVTSIDLSVADALLTFPTPYIKSAITKKAGGKGLLAARAAMEVGLDPILLACVGGCESADTDGAFLIAQTDEMGLVTYIKRVPGFRTAAVILVYLRENNPRMMVCDNDVIFQFSLCTEEFHRYIASSQMLYISSYLALGLPARGTIIEAIGFAQSLQILTVIDLVPHDLPDHIGCAAVVDLVRGVDVLVIAPVTLRQLVGSCDIEGGLAALARAGFSSLGIAKWLIVLDKIGGSLCATDGTEAIATTIPKVGRDAPATGSGEQIVFSMCARLLSAGN